MAERLYRPGRAYWREVSELDNTLFRRGSRDRSGIIGMFGNNRVLEWIHDEKDFVYSAAKSPLLMGRIPLGSYLLEIQELPVGDIRNVDRGAVGLVRKVSYVPAGVYAVGTHLVSDRQHTLRLDDTSKKEARDLRSIARKAEKEQRRIGYTRPTEETYLFILDTLKHGEETTRNRE